MKKRQPSTSACFVREVLSETNLSEKADLPQTHGRYHQFGSPPQLQLATSMCHHGIAHVLLPQRTIHTTESNLEIDEAHRFDFVESEGMLGAANTPWNCESIQEQWKAALILEFLEPGISLPVFHSSLGLFCVISLRRLVACVANRLLFASSVAGQYAARSPGDASQEGARSNM